NECVSQRPQRTSSDGTGSASRSSNTPHFQHNVSVPLNTRVDAQQISHTIPNFRRSTLAPQILQLCGYATASKPSTTRVRIIFVSFVAKTKAASPSSRRPQI